MKLGLLQRLESIPKEVKSRSSTKQEDEGVGSSTGSSTDSSSSSSDNESIIQELLRSASMELSADQQAENVDCV